MMTITVKHQQKPSVVTVEGVGVKKTKSLVHHQQVYLLFSDWTRQYMG